MCSNSTGTKFDSPVVSVISSTGWSSANAEWSWMLLLLFTTFSVTCLKSLVSFAFLPFTHVTHRWLPFYSSSRFNDVWRYCSWVQAASRGCNPTSPARRSRYCSVQDQGSKGLRWCCHEWVAVPSTAVLSPLLTGIAFLRVLPSTHRCRHFNRSNSSSHWYHVRIFPLASTYGTARSCCRASTAVKRMNLDPNTERTVDPSFQSLPSTLLDNLVDHLLALPRVGRMPPTPALALSRALSRPLLTLARSATTFSTNWRPAVPLVGNSSFINVSLTLLLRSLTVPRANSVCCE